MSRSAKPFPVEGFVRLKSILAPEGPIPVGKSTWWVGVKSKRYPQPVKLGPRITVWKAEDILKLMKDACPLVKEGNVPAAATKGAAESQQATEAET